MLPLVDCIRQYCDAHGITGRIPSNHKEAVLAIFRQAYKNVEVSSDKWSKARSLANDGNLVIRGMYDGAKPGERTQSRFARTALGKGRQNGEEGRGFVASFESKEACIAFCKEHGLTVEVRNKLLRLMKDEEIDVVTALKRLPNVMTARKAKKAVRRVFDQVCPELDKLRNMSASDFLAKVAGIIFNPSSFQYSDDADAEDIAEDIANGERVLGENGLHVMTVDEMCALFLQVGLAKVHKRVEVVDDVEDTYLDIYLPVSLAKYLAFMYVSVLSHYVTSLNTLGAR